MKRILLLFLILIVISPVLAYTQSEQDAINAVTAKNKENENIPIKKHKQYSFNLGINKVMNGIMDSWLGEDLNTVIGQWGYPNEEKTIANKHLYYWYTFMNAYVPAQTNGYVDSFGYYRGTTSGGYTINGQCTRILEVNQKNTVVSWQWEGNNCPFVEWFQYSKWRNRNIT